MRNPVESLIVLAAILFAISPVSAQSGTVSLAWDSPTNNTDGTMLTDLAGFKVYWGNSGTRVYSNEVNVGNVTTTRISLADSPISWPGVFSASQNPPNIVASWQQPTCPSQTFWSAATAYNAYSNESEFSEELVWTQSVVVATNYLLWGTSFPPTNRLACSGPSGSFANSMFPNKVLYFSAGAAMSDGRYSAMPQSIPVMVNNKKPNKPVGYRTSP